MADFTLEYSITTREKVVLETFLKAVCFAGANRRGEFFSYFCPLRITEVEMSCWMQAQSIMLDSSRYEVTEEERNGVKGYLYHLNAEGLARGKRLLYLTFFRYPDEFPHIVQEFDKLMYTAEDRDAMVACVYKMHSAAKYDNLNLHGFDQIKSTKPITLAEFKKRLADPYCSTVHSHFVN